MLDEPPNTHCRSRSLGLGLVGRPVGFLLAADKGADFFNAFGAAGSQHLRHFDNPVSFAASDTPLSSSSFFQVVTEPLVPDRQQAEEAGLASPLTAHQTEHFLIFGAGAEYPPDSPSKKSVSAFSST